MPNSNVAPAAYSNLIHCSITDASLKFRYPLSNYVELNNQWLAEEKIISLNLKIA